MTDLESLRARRDAVAVKLATSQALYQQAVSNLDAACAAARERWGTDDLSQLEAMLATQREQYAAAVERVQGQVAALEDALKTI